MATLTFFCGKMGSGKSTLSKQIAAEQNAVLLSEDAWLSTLYPQQIRSFEDYLKYASRLRPLIKSHIIDILRTNTNVIMDFPANTIKQREWLLDIAIKGGAKHQLIYLDVSDEQCLKQVAKRRGEQPDRAGFDTPAVFKYVTSFFEQPNPDEGLHIKTVTP